MQFRTDEVKRFLATIKRHKTAKLILRENVLLRESGLYWADYEFALGLACESGEAPRSMPPYGSRIPKAALATAVTLAGKFPLIDLTYKDGWHAVCGDKCIRLTADFEGDVDGDFKMFGETDTNHFAIATCAEWREALQFCIMALDHDSTRYALGAVHFSAEHKELVATDAKRLHICKMPSLDTTDNFTALLPFSEDMLSLTPRTGSAMLYRFDRTENAEGKALKTPEHAWTRMLLGNFTVDVLAVEGRFPRYRDIGLQDNVEHNVFHVDQRKLWEAANDAVKITPHGNPPYAHLHVVDGMLVLSMNENEIDVRLPVCPCDVPVDVYCDASCLRDVVDGAKSGSGTVRLETAGDEGPFRFDVGNKSALIMPLERCKRPAPKTPAETSAAS